jgi:hypothetical protein
MAELPVELPVEVDPVPSATAIIDSIDVISAEFEALYVESPSPAALQHARRLNAALRALLEWSVFAGQQAAKRAAALTLLEAARSGLSAEPEPIEPIQP